MSTMVGQPDLPLVSSQQGLHRWMIYAAAVALPTLTLVLRLILWDYAPGLPFVTFIPSVALLAAVGGVGPALAAAVLSAVFGFSFLSAPSPLSPGSQAIWIGFATYATVGAILLVFTDRMTKVTARQLRAEADRSAAREAALQARLEAAEAAARQGQAERRLEEVMDALPVFISQVGRDLCFQFANRTYEDWFGLKREEVVGRHLRDVIGPQGYAQAKPHLDRVLAGEAVSFEARMPHRSGETRVVRANYVPHTGPDGEVEGYFAVVQDITEATKQAELLTQRERHLRAVMESVTDCFYAADKEWRITLINRAAERYFGRSREELMGVVLWEAFPSIIGTEYEDQLRAVMNGREPATFEAASVLCPGRYIEMRVSPKEGSGIAVSFSDITCRKAQERQRELLIHELNHRVKNTLAVIQSIAAKTFTDTGDPRASRRAFEGRLMALAAAHDHLTKESWEAAELGSLVRSTLGPFGAEHRLAVSGPDLRVRPQVAVSLSLALHELATNAAKYGALSNEAGTVTVRWTVTKGEMPMFRLVWQERGGPEVVPPTRAGFGSRLIKQGLSSELGGPVSLDYAPDGLVCTIEAPVGNLRAE